MALILKGKIKDLNDVGGIKTRLICNFMVEAMSMEVA